MRIATGAVLAAAFTAGPAFAQSGGGPNDQFTPVSLANARPGSPSNATSTVSPSTVPQNMERLDDTGRAFTLSVGTLYAEGDFGTNSDTSIVSSALAARFRTGGLRLTASLPWMRIRSNAVIFTGIDSTPVLVAPPTTGGRRLTTDGFGDVTLGAAYTLTPSRSGTELELSGRVKLDTATRSSGLSSGEKDYAVGAQVTQPLGRVAPFASVTYRFLGDPAQYRLRDGVAASAGASVMLGRGAFLLASYHFSERATRLVKDAHELFAGASMQVRDTRLRVTGFGTAGLSRGAAGLSAGVALSHAF